MTIEGWLACAASAATWSAERLPRVPCRGAVGTAAWAGIAAASARTEPAAAIANLPRRTAIFSPNLVNGLASGPSSCRPVKHIAAVRSVAAAPGEINHSAEVFSPARRNRPDVQKNETARPPRGRLDSREELVYGALRSDAGWRLQGS